MHDIGPCRRIPDLRVPASSTHAGQLSRIVDPPSALRAVPEGSAVTFAALIDVSLTPYAGFRRCRARCSFRACALGKMLSIVARRDSQYSEERATHLLFVAEAATFRDRFDSV